ncbi:hypothetical protein Rhe02_95720 [Rhizocola hellebori]|uniref:Uncharacterized protein n=1 Tax=Rhizocola hellebori TaxID=1392758 RepID=A0A8J3QIJ4_9ACTN|nr:hypothetical protein Rhe02_95720 [Rhizocola hellebori]
MSRLHPAACGLLTLVDNTLARTGCRDDHPIWPLLREGGRLPGDALTCAAGWLPDELHTRADLLAQQRESEADVATALTESAGWEGEASAAFHARLASARHDLTRLDETGRLMHDWFTDLASYLDQARLRLAHILSRALKSSEAVTLKVGPALVGVTPSAQAEAAATIGATVLAEVNYFWQGSLTLSRHWSTRIDAAASATLAHASSPSAPSPTTLRADL